MLLNNKDLCNVGSRIRLPKVPPSSPESTPLVSRKYPPHPCWSSPICARTSGRIPIDWTWSARAPRPRGAADPTGTNAPSMGKGGRSTADGPAWNDVSSRSCCVRQVGISRPRGAPALRRAGLGRRARVLRPVVDAEPPAVRADQLAEEFRLVHVQHLGMDGKPAGQVRGDGERQLSRPLGLLGVRVAGY